MLTTVVLPALGAGALTYAVLHGIGVARRVMRARRRYSAYQATRYLK